MTTEKEISNLKGSIKLDQVELNSLEQEALKLGVANNSTLNNISIGVASIGGGILSAITGSKAWLAVLTAGVPIITLIGKLIDLNRKKQDKQNKNKHATAVHACAGVW